MNFLGSMVRVGWWFYLIQHTSKIRYKVATRTVGTTLAELPLGLWVIFFGFCLPLLAMAITTVRFGLFWEAAREAADAACQAQYYADNGTSPGQGAVTVATNTASNVAAMFSGVTVNTVNCYIVATPIVNLANGNASVITGPSTISNPVCLSSPADLTKNIYQIRVDVIGQIQPIFSVAGGLAIPGFTQPASVTVSQFRIYENGPGLSLY
jgi:hypothetical protein